MSGWRAARGCSAPVLVCISLAVLALAVLLSSPPAAAYVGYLSASGSARRLPHCIPSRASLSPSYVVVLKDPAADPEQTADRLARSYGLRPGHRYYAALRGFAAIVPEQQVQSLTSDPRVAYVEPDLPVSAAQRANGWCIAVPRTPRRTPAPPQEPAAPPILVAVLDTGIQADHRDLKEAVVHSRSFVAGTETARDGHGHGTHAAGMIAGRQEATGITGVAPDAKLWAVKVLDDSGNGRLSDVLKGIDYVTFYAKQVAVAHLGFTCSRSRALNAAVSTGTAAGVVFITAAGNSGKDAGDCSPASEPSAITVGALADSDGKPGGAGALTSYGEDDTFASFSNFGSCVDLVAPGVEIYSTWKDGGTGTLSGTSTACALASGAAAAHLLRKGRDLDGNGRVDGEDVSRVRDYLLGRREQPVVLRGAGDADDRIVRGPDGRLYPRLLLEPPGERRPAPGGSRQKAVGSRQSAEGGSQQAEGSRQ
jgi:subtilisin